MANDVEIFKNYMQMLIWAHNRLDSIGLRNVTKEIDLALQMGNITWHERDTLNTAMMIFATNLRRVKPNETMAQGFDPLSAKAATVGTMAGVLSDSEGDRRERNA